MGLFDSIRAALNPSGMKGLPMNYDSNAGGFKNLAGALNIALMAQPQFREASLGRQDYIKNEIANQNAPFVNALKNKILQEQGAGLEIENQYKPQTLQEKLRNLEINNQYLPQSLQSQIGLRNAQAADQYANASAAPSRIGLNQAQALLANKHAELLPQEMQMKLAMSNPTNQMMRYGSANIKEMLVKNMIEKGIDPFSPQGLSQLQQAGVNAQDAQAIMQGQQATPQMRKNANLLDMSLQKRNTPAQVLNRNLFATNIEKTLNTIDPSVIEYYSGANGKAQLAKDATLAATGNAPPEYLEYQSMVKTKIPMLTSQIRQFYGDSIQPSVREHLESLANTSTWQDPKVAAKRFNDLTNILGSELQTYRDAAKGTSAYRGVQSSKSAGIDRQKALEELRRRGHKIGG